VRILQGAPIMSKNQLFLFKLLIDGTCCFCFTIAIQN
jgi:hypothetical protein